MSRRNSSIIYLITVGRRTGLPRKVELWFAYHEGRVYLLGHRDSNWIRNLVAQPHVTLEMEGVLFKGIATVADEKRDLVYDLFREKYGKSQVQYWYGDHRGNRRIVEIALMESS